MNKKKQRQQHVITQLLLSSDAGEIALGKLLATGIMDQWEAWNDTANWQTAEHAAENMAAIITVAATMVTVTAAQSCLGACSATAQNKVPVVSCQR